MPATEPYLPDVREVIYSPNKLEAVIHYVIAQTQDIDNVGLTVLNKLLYFIDFDFYEIFEKSLMGETYIKNQFGPTSIHLETILHNLERQEKISKVPSLFRGHKQNRYSSLSNPEIECLLKHELRHIDNVINSLSNMSAREISDYSHGDIPYMVAKDLKPLNYELVFYREGEYVQKEHEDEL